MEQDLLTFPEHQSLPPVFKWGSCCLIFSFLCGILWIVICPVFNLATVLSVNILFPIEGLCHPSFIFINIFRDIVSKIIIDSARDGEHTINGTLIQHLFDHSPTSVIEEHIHLPVIRERPMVAHTHDDTDHHVCTFVILFFSIRLCSF